MKILLDTHVIIWALTDDPKLSAKARELITDKDNIVYFSLASIWEIAVKNRKAPEKCPYNEKDIAELCVRSGFLELGMDLPSITGLRELRVKEGRELSNFDPFDRMLLSQAKCNDMVLFSHDVNFSNYDEPCIFAM
ncbi:MAG: type II toxin-antitoxin system VapC family toxin [Lachnospiraceae bacterium]|nr:type II toxin-antitoxin system VapC family toxin [Lachnospiraceae bacterium]